MLSHFGRSFFRTRNDACHSRLLWPELTLPAGAVSAAMVCASMDGGGEFYVRVRAAYAVEVEQAIVARARLGFHCICHNCFVSRLNPAPPEICPAKSGTA